MAVVYNKSFWSLGFLLGGVLLFASPSHGWAQGVDSPNEREDGSPIVAGATPAENARVLLEYLYREELEFLGRMGSRVDEPLSLDEILEIQRRARNNEIRSQVVEARRQVYAKTKEYLEDLLGEGAASVSITGAPDAASGLSSSSLKVVQVRGQVGNLSAVLDPTKGEPFEVSEGYSLGSGWRVNTIRSRQVTITDGVNVYPLPWTVKRVDDLDLPTGGVDSGVAGEDVNQ